MSKIMSHDRAEKMQTYNSTWEAGSSFDKAFFLLKLL